MNYLSREVQFTKNTVTLTNSDTTETHAEESKNCILQTNIKSFPFTNNTNRNHVLSRSTKVFVGLIKIDNNDSIAIFSSCCHICTAYHYVPILNLAFYFHSVLKESLHNFKHEKKHPATLAYIRYDDLKYSQIFLYSICHVHRIPIKDFVVLFFVLAILIFGAQR